MQIFNIITNIFTIVGTIVGCGMFYFTCKNHQWLVADRKKQIEQEIRNKLNKIFSIVAEYALSKKINKILLPPNIVKDISNYNIPEEIIRFIQEDIGEEIYREYVMQTGKYKYLAAQIIQQYRNGTRLNDTDFNKLRSFFKDNKHIEECYNVLIKSP